MSVGRGVDGSGSLWQHKQQETNQQQTIHLRMSWDVFPVDERAKKLHQYDLSLVVGSWSIFSEDTSKSPVLFTPGTEMTKVPFGLPHSAKIQ